MTAWNKLQQELQPSDTYILIAFRRWLQTHGFSPQITFSSDDLREFVRLHTEYKQYFKDSQHDYGYRLAKWKINNVTVQVGEVPSRIPSNHSRKIDVYRMAHP